MYSGTADLAQELEVRTDQGRPHGGGLDHRQAEALGLAGQQHHVGHSVEIGDRGVVDRVRGAGGRLLVKKAHDII